MKLQSKFELTRCQETEGHISSLPSWEVEHSTQDGEQSKIPNIPSPAGWISHCSMLQTAQNLNQNSSQPYPTAGCSAALAHPCLAFLMNSGFSRGSLQMPLSCPGADFGNHFILVQPFHTVQRDKTHLRWSLKAASEYIQVE